MGKLWAATTALWNWFWNNDSSPIKQAKSPAVIQNDF